MKTTAFRNVLTFSKTFITTAIAVVIFSIQVYGNPPDTLKSSKDTTVKTSAIHAKKDYVYKVNYYVTGSIIGVGFATDAIAISRIKNKPIITNEELAALNPDLLTSIDKWGLRQDASQRSKFASISDYTESAFILLPALLMIDKKIRGEWLHLLLIYLEGHAVTFTFYNYSTFGPTFHNEYRPVTYYTDLPLDVRNSGNNRNSIYSGHVASIAYSTYFMAKVYCDYHPEMNFGKQLLIYTAATIPPALIGYFRVRSLAHFPSENFTGLMLGAAVGIIVPALHKRRLKNLSVGMFSAPEGIGLDLHYRIL
jgi:membrane-associated phospholipid phosphatase